MCVLLNSVKQNLNTILNSNPVFQNILFIVFGNLNQHLHFSIFNGCIYIPLGIHIFFEFFQQIIVNIVLKQKSNNVHEKIILGSDDY